MPALLQLAALVQSAPEAPAEGLDLGWALVKMVLVLGVVVALIYLTLNIGLRRLMGVPGMGGALGRARIASVVERIPLDQRRTMFVVKAAGEYLLIGGGDAQLSLLTRLDTETVERIAREVREAQARPPQLSPFLQKLLTRKHDVKPPPPPPPA